MGIDRCRHARQVHAVETQFDVSQSNPNHMLWLNSANKARLSHES